MFGGVETLLGLYTHGRLRCAQTGNMDISSLAKRFNKDTLTWERESRGMKEN